MDGTRRVDLGLVLAGNVGSLSAGEDVEVVVGGVAACVALSADGSACCVKCVSDGSSLKREAQACHKLGRGCLPKMIRYSVTEAWMMYMAPMAPPALLNTHSSSLFT